MFQDDGAEGWVGRGVGRREVGGRMIGSTRRRRRELDPSLEAHRTPLPGTVHLDIGDMTCSGGTRSRQKEFSHSFPTRNLLENARGGVNDLSVVYI